jgi:predicted amidohydrolase
VEHTLAAANVAICHDKSANLKKFVELIDEAGSRGADILVLPEMGLQGYIDFSYEPGSRQAIDQKRYYLREAETVDGPSIAKIQRHASKWKMLVQVGFAERALDGNLIFNSTALVTPHGVAGVYRKIHNKSEYPYCNPGERTPVFTFPFATVASLICYDLAFPELMRNYALKGATVALMSTAWPMLGRDRTDDYAGWAMDLCAQANAFFNQMWLVVSNHCEKGAYATPVDYWGRSQIVDPLGKVVSSLADEEGIVCHTADLAERVLSARSEVFFGRSLLQDRRPEHYSLVSDTRLYADAPTSGRAVVDETKEQMSPGSGDNDVRP